MFLRDRLEGTTSRERLARTYVALRSGELVQAYNEAAFRYFLTVDRRRAHSWMRSVLLVLVGMRMSPGRNAKLSDPTAAALFIGLRECCREVDLVGWYKQRRV